MGISALPFGYRGWPLHRGHFVTMVRQPEQRLISEFYHAQRCVNYQHPLTTFVQTRANCMVKMLNGWHCQTWMNPVRVNVTVEMVSTAIERLNYGFAFVGLTEEWALSVCLFHAMFGGDCHPREFVNTRLGLKRDVERYDTSALRGYRDEYDGAVYEHSVRLFRAALDVYGVNVDSCART